jgi:formate dehydrogenase subunit gamma
MSISPIASIEMLATVSAIVAQRSAMAGPLLPILHEVQETLGYIPAEVVPAIAEGLNLSRAEVHGVITYYHHFRTEPAGRHVLQLCRAESCQARGSEALWDAACRHLGVGKDGGTAQDGSMTIEPVYCLGLCAMSPSAMLDGDPHARLDASRLEALMGSALAQSSVESTNEPVIRTAGAAA